MIGRDGERESEKSVLSVRLDNDDNELKPYNYVQTNDYYLEIITWNHATLNRIGSVF